MRLHGGVDFGSVGHDAEHIGHVAAQGKSFVVKGGNFRCQLAAIDAGNAGHCASFKSFLMVSFPAESRAVFGVSLGPETGEGNAFDALREVC